MMLIFLALALVAGIVLRRTGHVSPRAPDLINAFIINAALPAMVLLRVPSLVLDRAALVPIALAWSVILLSALLMWRAARYFGWSNQTLGALLLVVPLSNSAYLGLPLIDLLLAPEVLPYAIIYDQLGNFMALAVYVAIVIALLAHSEKPPTVAGVVRSIFTFTPFLATLAALLLPADALPPGVRQPLSWLGATMGPLAMLIVGLQLEFRIPAALRGALALGATTKLIVAPALATALALLLGSSGPAVTASVAQAAMPPMITAGLIGMAAGFSRPLILALVGVATLASAVTVPIVLWLLNT